MPLEIERCGFYTTVVVPMGWQVVPIIPTPEMIDELTNGDVQKRNVMKLRYDQMLKTAPKPQ